MFEARDGLFASQLERRIMLILSGDETNTGLYRSVLSSQTWEQFNRTAGEISGYEKVLDLMVETARALNDDETERQRQRQRATDKRLS